MTRLRALWFGWSHTTRVVVVLVPSFLVAMTVGIVLGVQNGYIDMTTPTYPPFTTQEPPWSTTATTTLRKSGQANGATSIPTVTRNGGPAKTSRGTSSPSTATTRTTTGATFPATTAPPKTTTTQPTPDPTDPPTSPPDPGPTTPTVPEFTGGQP